MKRLSEEYDRWMQNDVEYSRIVKREMWTSLLRRKGVPLMVYCYILELVRCFLHWDKEVSVDGGRACYGMVPE